MTGKAQDRSGRSYSAHKLRHDLAYSPTDFTPPTVCKDGL